jgi:type II secretory pathway predicted ATPase ExeA/outer membrane protein OmpA-like peptidoglycan-associated protein
VFNEFYGLSLDPFRLSPDARFCFRHRHFSKAKAYMQYALHQGEGFVMVTGQPGTGKTTLIEDLLADQGAESVRVTRITSTQVASEDLLRLMSDAFGIDSYQRTKAAILMNLQAVLRQQMDAKRNSLLIVDEAQNLPYESVEELRMITNLQKGARPLLQVFLVGQDALRRTVNQPRMDQLRQRMLAACSLEPLDAQETRRYLEHRLHCAGWKRRPSLSGEAVGLLHSASGGIPRTINLLAGRLLLFGYIEEKLELEGDDVRTIIEELHSEQLLATDASIEAWPTAEVDSRANPDLSNLAIKEESPRERAQEPVQVEQPAPAISRPSPVGSEVADTVDELRSANGHGARATPGDDGRGGDDTCPHPGPLPEGEEDVERAAHDLHRETGATALEEGKSAVAVEAVPAETAPRDQSKTDTNAVLQPATPADGIRLTQEAEPARTAESGHDDDVASQPTTTPPNKEQLRSLAWIIGMVSVAIFATLGILAFQPDWVRSVQDRVRHTMERLEASLSSPRSPPAALGPSDSISRPPSPTMPPVAQSEGAAPPSAGNEASPGKQQSAAQAQTEPAVDGRFEISQDRGSGTRAPDGADHPSSVRGIDEETARSADLDSAPVITNGEAPTEIGEGTPSPAAEPPQPIEPTRIPTTVEAGAAESVEPRIPTPVEGGSLASTASGDGSSDVEPTPEPNVEELAPFADAEAAPTALEEDKQRLSEREPAADLQAQPDVVARDLATLMSDLRALGYDPQMIDGGSIRLSLHKEVVFPLGSANISAESGRFISKIAEVIAAYPKVRLSVIGHTDSSGPAEYNAHLSEIRASAVAALFRANGIPEERVTSEGRGESEPLTDVAVGGIPASVLNRRIELIMHETPSP